MLIRRAGLLTVKYGGLGAGEPPTYDTSEPWDSTDITLSGGDLTASIGGSSTGWSGVRWTKDLIGKRAYAEVTVTAAGSGSNTFAIGICDADYLSGDATVTNPGDGIPGASYRNGGRVFASVEVGAAPYATGQVVGMAADLQTGAIAFFVDGVLIGSYTLRDFSTTRRWRFCTWFNANTPDASVTINQSQAYPTPTGYAWIGDIS